MSMRYLGGFISASYNPLKVPNAPTIGTVTAGNAQVSVTFTAPSNVGGSAITSYIVLVRDSSSGATFTNTGSASPIVVTGLTNGNTYTAQVAAVNSYGPSAYSASSGSFVPVLPYNLFSWGKNTNGQLGLNDRVNRSSPVQVGSLTNWSQVAAGYNSSASIKNDGTLWTWGYNNRGQLGINITGGARSSPVQIGALTDWSQIAIGQEFCASIKTNNTLWTWGQNNTGQLGQNTPYSAVPSSPTQVGALTDWAQASTGQNHCAAVKTTGTLWTWGYNAKGQLGQNNVVTRSSPVQVGSLTDWASVSAGGSMCAAVKTGGTLWTWGYNDSGNLGLNDRVSRSSPVQVGALTNWSKVSATAAMCAAIKTDGTLWSWGLNTNGQLGLNISYLYRRSSPVQVGVLTNWSQVSAGSQFCVALRTDGTLWSWGYNSNGQLGQNNVAKRSSPTQVGALSTWIRISQGAQAIQVIAVSN